MKLRLKDLIVGPLVLQLAVACSGGADTAAESEFAETVEPALGDGAETVGTNLLLPTPITIIDERPEFDGDEDPQLQEFMAMTGATSWVAIHGGKAVRHGKPVPSFFDRGADLPNQPRRYVGVVTALGHYALDVDQANLLAANDHLNGGVAEPGMIESRGWSDGVDSRVRRTGAAIPQVRGQVASVNGGCSGALIAPRIVRTAAHCVIQFNAVTGGTPVPTVQFIDRRDGTATFHALDTTSFYAYGGGYIPGGCGTSQAAYNANIDACLWADYAYLILKTNWYGDQAGEQGFTSWYGYKTLAAADAGMELRSGGYPGCDDFKNPNGTWNDSVRLEDPVNCGANPNAFYEDTSASCKVGTWLSGTARWRTGCDVSPGDSGGALIQEGTAYLIGQNQVQDCTTCPVGTPNRTEPNRVLGHDAYLFNYQDSLRLAYPP